MEIRARPKGLIFILKNRKRKENSMETIISSCITVEWAANEGYIGSNPCRNIKPIKFERPQTTETINRYRIGNAAECLHKPKGQGYRRNVL